MNDDTLDQMDAPTASNNDQSQGGMTRLFVGSLSWDTTDNGLQEFFSQFGTVVSATVIMDRATNRSKGFGFVEMGSADEANAAVEKADGQELDGRPIVVNIARPKAPRDNS